MFADPNGTRLKQITTCNELPSNFFYFTEVILQGKKSQRLAKVDF
jgi:hypothetical protein